MKNQSIYTTTLTLKRIQDYKSQKKNYWKEKGEIAALALFHEMAQKVPAYKEFLSKNNVKPDNIQSIQDFSVVPVMDKDNYIDQYPISSLCWGGSLSHSYMLSASSGSTGKPYFWPRSYEQTEHGAIISEGIYNDLFHIHDKRTLYIVAFAMGTWIAGTYMMMSTQLVAQQGYPITVVTPGLNKDEILRLVNFGKDQFEQIILAGYPPFIKDIIDYGLSIGLDWTSIPMKFLFSGEAITEGWRTHLQEKVGFSDIFSDAINILGSADVGLIAHETPLTILLRKILLNNSETVHKLFGENRVPALYQFDPELRYFEEQDKELLVTTRSGIPLCRYNTKDVGKILWYEDLIINHQDLNDQLNSYSIWNLPIVSIFGRGKFSASLYGITIYPEYIKHILDHRSIEPLCTGKFVLKTIEDSNKDQKLEIHIELKEQCVSDINTSNSIQKTVLEELPKVSSEFRHLLSIMKQKVYPVITLHKYGDAAMFPRGIMKKTS